MNDLPDRMFGEIKIKVVQFYNTGIKYIPEGLFDEQTATNLNSFYLKYNNFLETIDKGLVKIVFNFIMGWKMNSKSNLKIFQSKKN